LPNIDTLIDIGVGAQGTPELYKQFSTKKLILIDPLDEAQEFFNKEMFHLDAIFYKTALGSQTDTVTFNIAPNGIGNSSILDVTNINYEGDPIEHRMITVKRLDDVVDGDSLGKVGIKIDTEGFELNVIRGAKEILKTTKFVLAEVRHNHESFKGVYKLHEFVKEMHDNGFVLTMIITAKPFIADLCFEPQTDLFE